ncbi:hypothetical protein MNBD_CHLOROFLEXI01-4607 [hydrothermal vent metagenome]|uniref:Uncharacterized protein n=1 Tax=hydrothermal vent metagenome TaxID=652676 RepID=A0A3B0UPZ3_9ZZZZ
MPQINIGKLPRPGNETGMIDGIDLPIVSNRLHRLANNGIIFCGSSFPIISRHQRFHPLSRLTYRKNIPMSFMQRDFNAGQQQNVGWLTELLPSPNLIVIGY